VSVKDTFGRIAAQYAAYRPEYTPALADALAQRAPARALAWEAGCGSGQLSTLLGDRFERVVATDASAEQIAVARPHPRVEYGVAPAGQSGLVPASADLCVAAQAAHWFDLEAYNAEIRRVGRPGCLVALITYATTEVEPDVDAAFAELLALVRPHWPPNRRSVDRRYADLPFPFAEEPFPEVAMTARWTAAHLIAYAGTWSATLALMEAEGADVLSPVHARIREAWGSRLRAVCWPLSVRAGHA